MLIPRKAVAPVLALAAMALTSSAFAADWRERPRGIDVSRFQERIDWERVGQTPIRFAFVQASRGKGNDCTVIPDRCGPDEWYRRNYRRATAVGIHAGPYHRAFASGSTPAKARADARAEADIFIEQVGRLHRGDLLPALDVEKPFSGLNQRRLRIWIRFWLRRVERHLGSRPIIYTNYSSWQATGNTAEFARAGHKLWIAGWGVNSPQVPAGNWGGRGWSIWQWTSSGSVRGIDGLVDRNRLSVRLPKIAKG